VGQSGGPTAAINATLAGVIGAELEMHGGSGNIIYGMKHGIEGMLKEELWELNGIFGCKEQLELLKMTPGAALGSCRKKLPDPDSDPEFFEKLFSLFEKYGIGRFYYIGGNDSMDTVAKVSAYAAKVGCDLRAIGVPKTIDNDLCGTDHTPGFGSAAKYIATTIAELRRDTAVYSQKSVTIVEIMGRDAGWLTAAASLADTENGVGADLIYLPELPFSFEQCCEDIRKCWESHSDLIVAVSEGIKYENGEYIGADSSRKDNFGHVSLSGTAKVLSEKIRDELGCKVRAIELNTPQRCALHVASRTDLDESAGIGRAAVLAANNGVSGVMAAYQRVSDAPYELKYIMLNVSEIANKVRIVPRQFINERGNNVTEEGRVYLRPLIIGEVAPVYENGIPKHFVMP
ncbi:MAG: 6-phosphofructokinase, partial [Clostridia bacterium]|nr:6-phosphofructokinase [Clostridia bacterium]